MNKGIQNKVTTSKIFTRFKKIPEKAFHDFYFFYQFYLPQITALEFEEYAEIKFNYIQSLYHLDKYHQFFKQSEELISELLNYQSFDARAKKMYEQILFYKAMALRNENHLEDSQKIFMQLLKLNPGNKIYKRKLFYLVFQKKRIRNRRYVAVIVFMIILSLICTGISVFIVQPFFSEWSSFLVVSRNLFFCAGIIGFVLLETLQFHSALSTIRNH